MNHEAVRERLDAYLDRELSDPDRAEVEGHLADCASCRAELAGLETLTTAAQALPSRIEPGPRVWREVRASIEPRPRTGRRPLRSGEAFRPAGFLRTAAAVAASLAVLWAGTRLVPRTPATDSRGSTAAREPGEAPAPELTVIGDDATPRASEWARMIWALEEQSLGADKVLAATLKENRNPDATAQAASVLPGLRVLDEAIDETARALRRNPGDPELARTLASQYEKRLSLVRLAVRLAQDSWT